MKQIILGVSALVILVLSSSCEDTSIKRVISAGDNNSELINYTELDSVLKIDQELDTSGMFYFGYDSIDINLDGDYDLIIEQRTLHESNNSFDTAAIYYPNCNLSLKNGLKIAIKNVTNYHGLGQTSTHVFVDTIPIKTRIDKITTWSDTDESFEMWIIPPIEYYSEGPWYNLVNREMYIGIRMEIGSECKYGWIKVFQKSYDDISFVSYALEK